MNCCQRLATRLFFMFPFGREHYGWRQLQHVVATATIIWKPGFNNSNYLFFRRLLKSCKASFQHWCPGVPQRLQSTLQVYPPTDERVFLVQWQVPWRAYLLVAQAKFWRQTGIMHVNSPQLTKDSQSHCILIVYRFTAYKALIYSYIWFHKFTDTGVN